MIGISAITFDQSGAIRIDELPNSELGSVSRRVSRVGTLDQGVAINDGGYSDGDRDFQVVWNSTPEQDALIRRLVRLHARLRVATSEGVFECAPQNFTPGPPESTFTLLVISRISE